MYKYKYNGKELQDELGLNVYDLGARNYDPSLGRFFNYDPKAQKYDFQSAYAISINNPVFHVDVNGEGVETDYKVLKDGQIVRADVNDGSEKNATDRIVETKEEKKTVRNADGSKTKTTTTTTEPIIENIPKGIITEGMNMKTTAQTIAYGGKDQPTQDDVVDFLVQFSEKIAYVEISGFETIKMNTKNNVLFVEPYMNNSRFGNSSADYGINTLIPGTLLFVSGHFHTHPDSPLASDAGIDAASGDDEIGKSTRKKNGKGIELPHYIYNNNGRKRY